MLRGTRHDTHDLSIAQLRANAVTRSLCAGTTPSPRAMPSPRGIDSPRTDAGKDTLDSKSAGENGVFVKKATGTEDRRTRALAGTTLGYLIGGVDESSAAEGSCDHNSMSDTPKSRVCALRGHPSSLDFPIHPSSSSAASLVRRCFLMYVNLTYVCLHILSEPN